MKTYKIYTKPSTEPITLSEAKLFLKIDSTDEDTLITSLITTARIVIENYCSISLITQKWKLVMDELKETYLYRYPVSGIDSITTYDSTNAGTVWANTNYRLDTNSYKILFNGSYTLPSDIREQSGVEIVYTAGYGTASDVPQAIKQALLIMVATLYENRGVCEDIPLICKTLLSQYVDIAKLGVRDGL